MSQQNLNAKRGILNQYHRKNVPIVNVIFQWRWVTAKYVSLTETSANEETNINANMSEIPWK